VWNELPDDICDELVRADALSLNSLRGQHNDERHGHTEGGGAGAGAALSAGRPVDSRFAGAAADVNKRSLHPEIELEDDVWLVDSDNASIDAPYRGSNAAGDASWRGNDDDDADVVCTSTSTSSISTAASSRTHRFSSLADGGTSAAMPRVLIFVTLFEQCFATRVLGKPSGCGRCPRTMPSTQRHRFPITKVHTQHIQQRILQRPSRRCQVHIQRI